MNLAQVPIGIGPPCALKQTINADDTASVTDLTTVTAVTLLVRRADGSTAQWSAQIVSVTPGQLTYQYPFAAGGGDCPVVGAYMVAPSLTVPGGTVPCYARPLIVTDQYSP